MRGEEQVFLEFRKLIGAKQRLVAHQKRHDMLGIAVFFGMQVQHELAERPLQPRQLAFQHGEARAGNLGRRLEIHQAHRLTILKCSFGLKFIRGFCADQTDLDIAVLVGAIGHVIQRNVGNDRQRIAQRPFQAALLGLAILDDGFEVRDIAFSFSARGRSLAAIALPISFEAALRASCASCSPCRQARRSSSSAISPADERGGISPCKGTVQQAGVFTNPADIDHGKASGMMREDRLPSLAGGGCDVLGLLSARCRSTKRAVQMEIS